MLGKSDSHGACYNIYVDEIISQDPNFNEVKRWVDGNLYVNWKNKTAAHYYYNCLANSGQLKPDDRILGASPILSALFVKLLDICWAFLWIEDAESSQEAQGIFETTADLPADLFQVRLHAAHSCWNFLLLSPDLQHQLQGLWLYHGLWKGTPDHWDVPWSAVGSAGHSQLAGYKVKSAVLACRALLRLVNTGRTSLSIIRVATKLYVFIVLSIPSASGSPVSSWMCSNVSISGLLLQISCVSASGYHLAWSSWVGSGWRGPAFASVQKTS